MDGNSALNTFCGTVEYLAPEVLRNEPYGKKVDWWAYGCVVFELLVGDSPFFASSQALTMKKIIEGDIYWPENLSESARDLIERLLHPIPEKRLTGEQVRKHRFFHTIQFDELRTMTPPIIPDLMSDSEDEDDASDGGSRVKKRRRGRKRNYLYAINKNTWRYMDQFSSLHHSIKGVDTDDDMDFVGAFSGDASGASRRRSSRTSSLSRYPHQHRDHTDAKRRSEMLRLMYPEEMGKLPQRPNLLNANNLEMSESLPVEKVKAEQVPLNNPISSEFGLSGSGSSTPGSSPARSLLKSSISTTNSDFFGRGAVTGGGARRRSRATSHKLDSSLQFMERISYGSRTPIKHISWMKSSVENQHVLAASGNFSMGIMQYDAFDRRFIQHKSVETGSSANYSAFSPCGQYLAYDLQRHIGLLRRAEVVDSTGRSVIDFRRHKHSTLKGHKLPITMVSWRNTGADPSSSISHPTLLAAAGSDSFVYVWNVRNRGSRFQHVFQKSGHLSYISALEWQPTMNSNLIVSGGGDSRLIFYDCEACRITQKIDYHENAIVGLQFSPDGGILASYSLDRNLVFFDARTWKIIKVLAHPSPVLYCSWSHDGKFFASVSRDVLRIWSFPDLQCVKTLTREGTVNAEMMHFDASSRYLACSTSMSAVGDSGRSGNIPTVVDMQTMALCRAFPRRLTTNDVLDTDDIFALDNELQRGEHTAPQEPVFAHEAPLTALCWSPNIKSQGGPLLATGSFDRCLSMWQVMQGDSDYSINNRNHRM